jgi:hypothetical protein
VAKRRTKAEKQLDDSIDNAYSRLGNGVEVMMFDLSKIFSETREAVAAGSTVDDAMASAIAKYRQN